MTLNKLAPAVLALALLAPCVSGCQFSRSAPGPALETPAAEGGPAPAAEIRPPPAEAPSPPATIPVPTTGVTAQVGAISPVPVQTPVRAGLPEGKSLLAAPSPSAPVPTALPSPTTAPASAPTVPSSSVQTAAKLLGHQIDGTELTFVFDEGVYGLRGKVTSVAVAGNFSEWDSTNPAWRLRPDDDTGVWTLQVPLGDRMRPGAAFVFVADGRRLQPPPAVDPNYLIPDGQGGSLLVAGGLAGLPERDEIIRRLEHKTYIDPSGSSLPYYLLMPQGYDPSQSYPLVIFLHGSGERGDNLAPVLPFNGAYEFMETARDYSYFMLIPQAPDGKWWNSSELADLVLGLLDEARGSFSIDPDRIYITGLSMGAYGMWRIVSQDPEPFAAGVSVSGGLPDLSSAPGIAGIPFKVFHGSNDSLVPVDASRSTVHALEAAGGTVTYVEFPGADHWIWPRVYTDPAVIDWLFAQKKAGD
jgi:predicted esterase